MDGGQSSQLAERFVTAWRGLDPGSNVIVRDVAKEPVPHLDAMRFGTFLAKPEERMPEQQAVIDYSDALIDELKHADVIVIGLPMYNFALPSTLKAYFNHIARTGVTFRYTEHGPVGLLTGKEAGEAGTGSSRGASRHGTDVSRGVEDQVLLPGTAEGYGVALAGSARPARGSARAERGAG